MGGAGIHRGSPTPYDSTPNRPAPPQNSARLPGSPRGVDRVWSRAPHWLPNAGEPGSPRFTPDWGAAAPHPATPPGESGSSAPHSAEPRSGARDVGATSSPAMSVTAANGRSLWGARVVQVIHREWSRAARQARCAPAQTTVTLLVMIVPLAHPLLASAEAGTFLEAALPCRSRPVLRALLPLTSSRRRPSSP